ncbi:hypothetical protein NC797_07135 [Aquibacillus sp. 3ASR75-11]|uniref:Uncharacterized protein n=1 Tax=Terrihalobacillus insolitus TaxID=2950438 RepID=A0A9X3WU49_9BACI|nr:hypothetical protein [Terrihalobacillus insolitus]MDC3424281.1 hypothetical protein [Terrihalobacillus insolitus]
MDFDISKFERMIKKHQKKAVETEVETGKVNVVRNVWNHDFIEDIDFDSFSYHDVIYCLEAMECIALAPIDEGEEVFIVDPHNPFIIYNRVEHAIFDLFHAKNKIYSTDEEEIFI